MSAIHHLDASRVSGRRVSTSVLESVRAEGSVQGLLFELSVEQCYLNASDDNIEAVYTFPVAWNAVLLGVECILGDKVLQGTVVVKADAERRYEGALEEGNAAVMVERASDGMYTVNVGNLLPGERAILRFRSAQLLSFTQGQIRLVVPTTIGPRYGSPQSVGLQPHQMPQHDLVADYPFSLSVTLHGDMANAKLSSPSHPMSMQRSGDGVTLTLAESTRLDRDVVLVADGLVGKSITTLSHDGDGYVALASFCPPAPHRPRDTALNLKILVDCSGSMNGDRIEAARRALHEVLSHLEPEDNFSYSRFGSDVSHSSASLMAATPRAIEKASHWVAATDADMGGTEIAEALLSTYALAQPFDADILLVTDGDVWEADRLIASAIRAGQRIFAVGIGSAPASSLLQALASRTGGACECVDSHDEIAGAILRTFHRMRQAPVRDVTVTWDGEPRWQSSGGHVVMSGDTVHHVAGFAHSPPTSATLSWRDDAANAHQVHVAIDDEIVDGHTLARVAATMRMIDLMPAEGHTLALQHGLIGPTTNLVLVHERPDADKPDQLPSLQQVAHMLPAGWGGLGTIRQGTFSSPADASLRASVHAAGSMGPAVWRREHASATFRVAQQQADTYDIPAFLRKQTSTNDYLYRDDLRRFAEALAATDDATRATPTSLADLAAQVPKEILGELQALIDVGFEERDVVHTFIEALLERFRADGFATRLRDAIRRWSAGGSATPPQLARQVRKIVSDAVDARPSGPTEEIPAWLRRAAD
jgi:Ca-activated chloride channel family protein